MTSDRERQFLERLLSAEIEMWHGNAPLARVFWGHGVVLSNLLLGLYGATIYFAQPLAEQVLLICLGLYTLWILVSIWRSAAKVVTVWGLFARMLTVAWAVNIGLILLFREMELIMIFFGR